MYIPILPKHIWEDQTLESIHDRSRTTRRSSAAARTRPSSGRPASSCGSSRTRTTGARKGAAEEVVLQFYASADTMVQALKSGDLDYAIGINADQFDSLKSEPDIAVVNGVTNGWTMLNINSYDKDIPGGGASTKALRDPAFRDAIGYAIDKETLVDRVLGGYGDTRHDPGAAVPGALARRAGQAAHVRHRARQAEAHRRRAIRPTRPASGSTRKASRSSLRLYLATDSVSYEKAAAFIVEWFAADRHQGDDGHLRRGHAHRDRAAAAKRARATRPTGT